MKATLFIIPAFAATALADATIYTACEGDCGYASVVSHCNEDIYFLNQPSEGPAQAQQILKAGSTYSQVFTAMPNKCGWSMKFSPDSSFPQGNTQQYEYTWQGAGQPVWYDMSYVDGSPYKNWNFTSSDDSICDPTDAAYRFSTDDLYGMQAACPSHVTLTLHLCPDQASGSGAESAAPSPSATEASSTYIEPTSTSEASSTSVYVAPTTTAAPSTTLATKASTSSAAASSSQGYGNKVQVGGQGSIAFEAGSEATTTAAPVATAVVDSDGAVVTETQVEVVTAVQTMYVSARDAAPSPAAHAHRRRHEHRHPHSGRA